MMHANNGQVTPKTQHLLSDIHRELETLSSIAWLIHASAGNGDNSNPIKVASRDLSFRIDEQAEKLEVAIKAVETTLNMEAVAEQARKQEAWLNERLANLPVGAVEAFQAANAAYGIKTEGGAA
jgi:hypothetical protein